MHIYRHTHTHTHIYAHTHTHTHTHPSAAVVTLLSAQRRSLTHLVNVSTGLESILIHLPTFINCGRQRAILSLKCLFQVSEPERCSKSTRTTVDKLHRSPSVRHTHTHEETHPHPATHPHTHTHTHTQTATHTHTHTQTATHTHTHTHTHR